MLGKQIKSAAGKPKLFLKPEVSTVKLIDKISKKDKKPVITAAAKVVDENSDDDEFDNMLQKNSATPLMERVKKRLGNN